MDEHDDPAPPARDPDESAESAELDGEPDESGVEPDAPFERPVGLGGVVVLVHVATVRLHRCLASRG